MPPPEPGTLRSAPHPPSRSPPTWTSRASPIFANNIAGHSTTLLGGVEPTLVFWPRAPQLPQRRWLWLRLQLQTLHRRCARFRTRRTPLRRILRYSYFQLMIASQWRSRSPPHALPSPTPCSVPLQAPAAPTDPYVLPTPRGSLPRSITLYQYEVCPFCCKVKAFLDYYKVCVSTGAGMLPAPPLPGSIPLFGSIDTASTIAHSSQHSLA